MDAEGDGKASHYVRTDLCLGMEGCFQISDELSVDLTMEYGLETVIYVAQMNKHLVYGHGATWYAE